METQVFLSRDGSAPDADRIATVVNRSWKPRGGLWTSTLGPGGRTDWDRWLDSEGLDWYEAGGRFLLEPLVGARTYELDSESALLRLFDEYGRPEEMEVSLPGTSPFSERHYWQLDWEAVARDFDAVHLTRQAMWGLRLDYMLVYGWDAESTVWFRWCFERATVEVVRAEATDAA